MKLLPLSVLVLLFMCSSASSPSVTDSLKRKERRVDTIMTINPKTLEEEMVIDKSWDPASKDKVIHTGRFYGRDSMGVYTFVNDNPEFPGGDDALVEHIRKNTRYPESERNNKTYKRVLVRFVVNPDGSVVSPKILSSAGPAFDAEAIRVVKTLPKFIPGKQDGKPVPVFFNIPINFVPKIDSMDVTPPGTCLVLLNGKKINRGTTVLKEDVAKLCTMTIIGPKGNMKPSSFEWVIGSRGTIRKGTYPSADDCAKLKNLTSQLQKDDIIFIDSITFQGISGLCQEQFYLKVE